MPQWRQRSFWRVDLWILAFRVWPHRQMSNVQIDRMAHLRNYSPVSTQYNSGLGDETDLSATGELTPLGTMSLHCHLPPLPPPGLMSPLFLIPDAQLQNGMANTSQAPVTTHLQTPAVGEEKLSVSWKLSWACMWNWVRYQTDFILLVTNINIKYISFHILKLLYENSLL